MDLEATESPSSTQNNPSDSKEQRKRRHPDCDEYPNESCVPVVESESAADYIPAVKFRAIDVSGKVCLTDFPDEILYEIFKNLDSWTYYMLIKCCNRFATLLEDRRFWQHLDLSQKSLSLAILENAMRRTHKGTACIKLRGSTHEYSNTEVRTFNKTLKETFALRCTQLTVLELRGVTVDLRNVRIVDFPKTIKRLVFRDCDVCKPPEEQTIFCGIHTHLLYLEELGIEFSNWFEPYHIMMISKIPSLRWLSLKGCKRFGEFIPYGSMAARFGFKKLEYLDLRFTPVNDSDLQCFNVVLTLKELLLDCPSISTACSHETNCCSSARMERKHADTNDCQPSTSKASATTEDNESTVKTNTLLNASPSTSTQEEAGQHSCKSPQLASPTTSSTSTSPSSSSSSSSSSSAMNSPFASPSRLALEQPAADNNLPEPAGNVPSRSRFLPRPDQVILLDFVSRRPSIRHIRPLPNADNHFDGLLQHPLFWNIINPLGRGGGEGNRPCTVLVPASEINHRTCPVSDRGICSFGRPQNPVEAGVIWIRIGNRPSENGFVRLSVRNYKRVTDISLHHLVQCSPDLVYLDLSGTSVTREGVQRFKAAKPECQIIADHLIMTRDDEDCAAQNLSLD